MPSVHYNERAWGIELISRINAYCTNRTKPIIAAGGEHTLRGSNGSLFPDVLLFGDEQGVRVRHGWELKFPDTPVSDPDFYSNAEKKANRLQVNSFLLWNVNEAVLYIKGVNGVFLERKRWGPLGVTEREMVRESMPLWEALLGEILDDLNNFFMNGELKSSALHEIIDDGFMAGFIDEFKGVAAGSIKNMANTSAFIEAEIQRWWNLNASEYGKKPGGNVEYNIIAMVALTGWLNRFLFCQYLKSFHQVAVVVETVSLGCSLTEAARIFQNISVQCDFLQILFPTIASEHIGEEAWQGLCQVNDLLTEAGRVSVSQEVLQRVMENALQLSRRKAAGQYATPNALACFLVGLAVENRIGHVMDPCCGTGTIVRAAYELKRSRNQTVEGALSTLWASDKFQFPLSLCTMALADPQAMGSVVQIFCSDVFDLRENNAVVLADPNTGNKISRMLPLMSSIVSNLPFVRFESIEHDDQGIRLFLQSIEEEDQISKKSDLFAYIIVYLEKLLQPQGRAGVIVSNAWLGTEWGKKLRAVMAQRFCIRTVVISGAGRWFENAEVVTTLLVLEKKSEHTRQEPVKFVTTLKPLSDWNVDKTNAMIADVLASTGDHVSDLLRINTYSDEELAEIEQVCASWACFFSDVRWILDIRTSLTKVSSLFQIARGQRRGWNNLFYPQQGHGIESDYIVSVLRTMADVHTYMARSDVEAFCCSESIEDLERLGHHGAVRWIRSFEGAYNNSGQPLTEVLASPGCYWYEMAPNTLADIVLGMNPEDRLFAAMMSRQGFVDQRLIRMTKLSSHLDVALAHALLNTTLGMFFIEAAGFGRALGALDLQPTKLRSVFYMLNPALLAEQQRSDIKEAFDVIKNRDVLHVRDELHMEDRRNLDRTVLEAYGLENYEGKITRSLLELYRIRKAVKENATDN
ncbi:MAG: N-6 DNA methylase [Alphaproteobacteria bacterium]|nr:N-6 DNA methylase [Alphaproteobacteria bacterium]